MYDYGYDTDDEMWGAEYDYNQKRKRIEKAKATRAKNKAKYAGKKKKPAKTLAQYRKDHKKIPGKVVKQYEKQFEISTDSNGRKTARYKAISKDGTQKIKRKNQAPLGRRPQDRELGSVYDRAQDNLTGRGKAAQKKKNARQNYISKQQDAYTDYLRAQDNPYGQPDILRDMQSVDIGEINAYLEDCGIGDSEDYKYWRRWGKARKYKMYCKLKGRGYDGMY